VSLNEGGGRTERRSNAPGDRGSPWLRVPDVSARLKKCDETIRRYVRDQILTAYRIGAEFRFHLDDILAWEARQRVEPLAQVFDALSDATCVALHKALPRIRREAPAAIPALLAALKFDQESRIEQMALDAMGGATVFSIALLLPNLPKIELTGSRIEAEGLREQRRTENHESRRTNGTVDPLWAISHIIDVTHWKLIEPTIAAACAGSRPRETRATVLVAVPAAFATRTLAPSAATRQSRPRCFKNSSNAPQNAAGTWLTAVYWCSACPRDADP
jgi:hypothetical protein